MKKLLFALVLWGSVLCTPVFAKTFVGVLWPMFGPLPAIGLVELVAELKTMPDVEVSTYLHQNWPSLVEDIERQPPGTRTVVVGYSLGANSSVFVANKANYVDVIIALQPSMLSWNPAVTGRVGRMIEIYNPDPSMTFGGMGSKRLIGPNIEYIANNDSHPGAQFSSDFRNLVKSEIARVSAEPAVVTAQARTPGAPDSMAALAYTNSAAPVTTAQVHTTGTLRVASADTRAAGTPRAVTAEVPIPAPMLAPKLAPKPAVNPARAAQPQRASLRQASAPVRQSEDATALLDAITSSVNSGNLFAQRQLTVVDMMDYANRNYRKARTAELLPTDSEYR